MSSEGGGSAGVEDPESRARALTAPPPGPTRDLLLPPRLPSPPRDAGPREDRGTVGGPDMEWEANLGVDRPGEALGESEDDGVACPLLALTPAAASRPCS